MRRDRAMRVGLLPAHRSLSPEDKDQHSPEPSPRRRSTPGRRRWVTVTAGVAVIAAASTTAWAAANHLNTSVTASAFTPSNAAATTPASTSPGGAATASPAGSPGVQPTATASLRRATGTPTPATEAESPRTVATSPPKPVKAAERRAETRSAKPKARVISSGACGASFYDEPQMTASGERFNPSAMTAAHRTLALGTRVRVTAPASGESVTVRINDRGPYVGGRCLDLSRAAFAKIGSTDAGVMRVKYEVLAR
ncbi:septal ring lytic transglycosylase RlpA family protein [Nonomuraea sp. LPB2021202275-12-8]|uniref:septal ring lytic transglycosylase RlpA family protein n=1 Tax=Nonomuraea sp. LPB2021202275-12-8 TaxID=3120159 RepID=UPI00300DBBD1